MNKAVCRRSAGMPHGLHPESAQEVSARWENARQNPMTILELLEFLRVCHKKSPFLNFNGNVFAEIARQIVGVSLIGMPISRIEAATSLAAHFVAGVLDKAPAINGIRSLLKVSILQPGDEVTTSKLSARGKVSRILPDGRVAWVREGRKSELLAVPESLIKLEPGEEIPHVT
jgi:hypothetical protein